MHARIRIVIAAVVIFIPLFGSAAWADKDGFDPVSVKEIEASSQGSTATVIAGVTNRRQAAQSTHAPVQPANLPQPGPTGPIKPSFLPFHSPSAVPAALSADQVVAAASRVAGSVQVPAARFVMQPDPARNEWNALPVGFPVWLHVEHPDGIRQQVSDGPVTVELDAYPVAGLFETGDGRRYRCVGTSVRGLDEDPKAKSPTCHHVYLDRGDYVISARVEWRVDWSALGQSGSLRLVSEPDFYQLKVIELRSVVTR